MKPVYEIGKFASWISEPDQGIDNKSGDFEYVKIHDADLNDLGSILNIVKKIKPQIIFHLASHANVRSSFDNPSAVINNNIFCTLNLLEAVKITKVNSIIQICSTSEVYGKVSKAQVPIKIGNDYPFLEFKSDEDVWDIIDKLIQEKEK